MKNNENILLEALEKIANLENPIQPYAMSVAQQALKEHAANNPPKPTTNALDELERWANKGMVKSTLGIIAGDKYTLGYNGALTDLVTKIQSLKPLPTPPQTKPI